MATDKQEARDRLMSRVRKLLALAEGDANEHESQRALERAHELMREHGLEMAQVQAEEGTDWDMELWRSEEKSQFNSFEQYLLSAVGSLFGVRVWLNRSGKWNRYRVSAGMAGEAADLALAKEVWPWLIKRAKMLARSYCGKGWNASHRTFAEAFSGRIATRARQLEAEAKDESQSGGYALVVADKEHQLTIFMEDKVGKLRDNNRRGKQGEVDYGAAMAGRTAGDRENINFRGQGGHEERKRLA